MLKIFVFNAGGHYAVGTAVVAAATHEHAKELANAASDRKYGLTYHGIVSGKEPVGISPVDVPQVLNIHEFGMPELPSRGSGIKVTF